MLATIPLTEEEYADVEDGETAFDHLLERLVCVLPPAGPAPRQLAGDRHALVFTLQEQKQLIGDQEYLFPLNKYLEDGRNFSFIFPHELPARSQIYSYAPISQALYCGRLTPR